MTAPTAPASPTSDLREGAGLRIAILLIGTPLFALLLCCGCDGSSGSASEKPIESRSVEAWWIIQDFAKSALKSPSTASFPTAGHLEVRYLGERRFEVTSSVDAQNSLGAMLRKSFYCRVRLGETHWINEEFRWIN